MHSGPITYHHHICMLALGSLFLVALPSATQAQTPPPLPTQSQEQPKEETSIPPLPKEGETPPRTSPEKTPPPPPTQTPQPQDDEISFGKKILGRIYHSFRSVAWLETTGYTIGTTMQRGSSHHSTASVAGGPQVMGYTIQERNGIISGLVLAVLGKSCALLGAGAIGMSAYQVTGVSTSRSYHSDGTVWETKTTYYGLTADADEKFETSQNMIDASEGMGTEIASYRGGQNFEFTYYTDDWMGRGLGQTQGLRANFLLGFPAGKHLIFEAGYGWGRSTSTYENTRVESRFNGIPLRLVKPLGPLALQAGWDLNFATLTKYFADSSTPDTVTAWPVSLTAHAFLWRFHLTAGVELTRLLKLDTAYTLGAGMRF